MKATMKRRATNFPPARWTLGLLFLASSMVNVAANEEIEEQEIEPSTAVLFPWFSEALGVIVFFLMTRFVRTLPFTAIMFLLGIIMGVAGVHLTHSGRLTESIFQWGHINSEVLLLIFLPGLVFRDAFGLNVRLFVLGINQLILLAFPMVLAGTCLTALVGFYILPYQWSFNLSMTFGSILAATDPVAVSSLLNEVGAPPRLKIHISGESLLNDGSAFVFFTIFSLLFLYELGIPGLGEDVDVARGFAIFFRMALGGVAFGLAFGLGLIIILYCLSRRLNTEENVIQVAATITIAYLAYYTADICDTSGLIATVFTGVTANAFGSTLINDPAMMESFWILVEHLLQTLLFTLAGTVWGGVVASNSGISLTGSDFGYIILVYVLVNVIRFFLVGAFYPIFSRIGLKSCWQESVFLGYAGLRGAVGIALALSLDNEVREATEETPTPDEDIFVADTTQLFAIVGGVALLTLVINGTSSGPVLIKLGLAKSSKSREKLVEDLKRNIKQHMMDEFVKLMAEFRFKDVDFSVVKHHVPFVQDLTIAELEAAVQRNESIATPNLENVLPYLVVEEGEVDLAWAKPPDEGTQRRRSTIMGRRKSLIDFDKRLEMDTVELRQFFLGILRCCYGKMVDHGELDGRDSFVTLVLLDGLEFAATDVDAGKVLRDWENTEAVGNAGSDQIAHLFFNRYRHRPFQKTKRVDTIEYQRLRVNVLRALAFLHAHRLSLEYFEDHIVGSGEFGESEKIVVAEVKTQMRLATQVVEKADDMDVETLESHAMCSILLNRTALYVESLLDSGVLRPREANVFFEAIEEALEEIHRCDVHVHPGHLSKDEKSKHLSVADSRISHSDVGADDGGVADSTVPDGSTD